MEQKGLPSNHKAQGEATQFFNDMIAAIVDKLNNKDVDVYMDIFSKLSSVKRKKGSYLLTFKVYLVLFIFSL